MPDIRSCRATFLGDCLGVAPQLFSLLPLFFFFFQPLVYLFFLFTEIVTRQQVIIRGSVGCIGHASFSDISS